MKASELLRRIEKIITDYEHENGYAYFGSLEDRVKFALEPSVAVPTMAMQTPTAITSQLTQH